MKHLVFVLPLACAAMLLSGCPNAKLPTPTPTVPTPKANAPSQYRLPANLALNQPRAMPASTGRSRHAVASC